MTILTTNYIQECVIQKQADELANEKDEEINKVVQSEEIIIRFVHSVELPNILPNIKPTGRTIAFSLAAFYDSKNNPRTYWNQGIVLMQAIDVSSLSQIKDFFLLLCNGPDSEVLHF